MLTPWAAPAFAQPMFPNKPVKIIVGFPAGSPLDAHARLLADRLGQLPGQPVIVDYKAGASTFIVHIPYRGSAPAFTDLLAGQVQMMAESIPQAEGGARQARRRSQGHAGDARNSQPHGGARR